MLAFVVSFIALLVIGIVTYRAVQTLISQNERVVHTQEVLVGLQRIRTAIVQAESDGRGYMITGDPAFSDAFNNRVRELPGMVESLRQLTADNPAQTARFETLQTALSSRLELLNTYVVRREQAGVFGIPTTTDIAEGRRRMEVLRAALDDIGNEERRLLNARVDAAARTGRQLLFTVVLAIAVLTVLLGLVFYLTYRDIQNRKANEARLRTARDELEERVRERTAELTVLNTELERSNRELEDFAFVASHDLQEPLRKIQAFGDRLLKVQGPKFDDQGRDYLGRMHAAAERMHVLINDLLSYSRVTTKAQPFQPTDLAKLVGEVLDDLENRIETTGGSVKLDQMPTIDADAVQMRQLFQNLIANALKFSKADLPPEVIVGSEIISAESDNGRPAPEGLARITVRDNGIGFDEKYLDRIFTPFQRLHGRNEYEGTGIGLAVCRKIVERHGGSLTAKSTPGEGATFIATLPLAQTKEK